MNKGLRLLLFKRFELTSRIMSSYPSIYLPLTGKRRTPTKLSFVLSATAIASIVALHQNERAISQAEQASTVLENVDVSRQKFIENEEYTRIDLLFSESPSFKHMMKNNAVHDTVRGDGLIEAYEIYRRNNHQEIVAVVKFGNRLNGHPKIVHGGITSMMFDNTYGWLFFALGIKAAVTANLSVNFRLLD